MVQVLIIIPYSQVQDKMRLWAEKIRDPSISVQMTHVYGTSNPPEQYRNADIIVARGMTCSALRRQYPEKHIIEISMTSFDVLDAIAESKRKYRPNKVAVCMQSASIMNVASLEELSGLTILTYDVADESQLEEALRRGQAAGAEVFVGGLTLCRQCGNQNLACTHIKTSDLSLERAVSEAISTAQTINQERTKTLVIQSVLNNTPDAIFAVDNEGCITALNDQAYHICHIPSQEKPYGKKLDRYCPDIGWEQVILSRTESEKLQRFFGSLYFVRCRPILTDENCAGALITVMAADKIRAAETKIRKELTTKGLTAKYSFDNIIGVSPALKRAVSIAYKYSQVDANVLLVGETGTGKELFAHSIHRASKRSHQPFVAVNCAALPENLLESELFGYVEGAFSGASKGGKIGLFELAHKGTIFLDEIGELPIALQAKLLRVLQEKEIRRIGDDRVVPVDVRVISATNIDIEKQISTREFRADLFYRLNLLNLQAPPLRERSEDVMAMADYFLRLFGQEYQKSIPTFSPKAVALLQRYSWPGNARELRNFCEKLMVLNESPVVDDIQLRNMGLRASNPQPAEAVLEQPDNISREQLMQLLSRQKLKQEDLARMLGVSRTTLWRWAKKQQQ